MIKDGGKSLNSRIYLQKLKKNILVESWQKYFKIPTGLTNVDMERRKKKHAKICDIMPTSKGEGRIRENLKCAEKQAASARVEPETNRFYSSLLQDQKRGGERNTGSPSYLGAVSPCHWPTYTSSTMLGERRRHANAQEKGLIPQQYCTTTVHTVWLLGDL